MTAGSLQLMLMLKGDVATTYTFSGGPSGAMKIEKNQLPCYIEASICHNTTIEKTVKKDNHAELIIHKFIVHSMLKGTGKSNDVITFKIITMRKELPYEKLMVINT